MKTRVVPISSDEFQIQKQIKGEWYLHKTETNEHVANVIAKALSAQDTGKSYKTYLNGEYLK